MTVKSRLLETRPPAGPLSARRSHLLAIRPQLNRVIFAAFIAALTVAGFEYNADAQGAPPAAGQPPAPPPPDPRAARRIKQRFEREPTVQEVQKAALHFFFVEHHTIERYRRNAFLKGLMPDLEITGNLDTGRNDRRMIDAIYRQQFPIFKEDEDTTHFNTSVNLRAHWALDRLVFNAEVLDVISLVGVQEGLLREITSLYFTRRRLLTFLELNPPQDIGERITESIRLDEISANLDALTGGFFTKEVQKRMGTIR